MKTRSIPKPKTDGKPKKKKRSFASIERQRLLRDFPQLVKVCRFERQANPLKYYMRDGEVILRLPLPPDMGNARLHWRSKDSLRKLYNSQCEELLEKRLLPQIPKVPLVYAKLHVTLCVKREHDHDNAVARCKFACDFLQRAGYIESDKPRCLEWEEMPLQKVSNALPLVIFTLKDFRYGTVAQTKL